MQRRIKCMFCDVSFPYYGLPATDYKEHFATDHNIHSYDVTSLIELTLQAQFPGEYPRRRAVDAATQTEHPSQETSRIVQTCKKCGEPVNGMLSFESHLVTSNHLHQSANRKPVCYKESIQEQFSPSQNHVASPRTSLAHDHVVSPGPSPGQDQAVATRPSPIPTGHVAPPRISSASGHVTSPGLSSASGNMEAPRLASASGHVGAPGLSLAAGLAAAPGLLPTPGRLIATDSSTATDHVVDPAHPQASDHVVAPRPKICHRMYLHPQYDTDDESDAEPSPRTKSLGLVGDRSLFQCRLCNTSVAYLTKLTHLQKKHQTTLPAYMQRFGKTEVLRYHSCAICDKSLLWNRRNIASHVRKYHEMKEKVYEAKYKRKIEAQLRDLCGVETGSRPGNSGQLNNVDSGWLSGNTDESVDGESGKDRGRRKDNLNGDSGSRKDNFAGSTSHLVDNRGRHTVPGEEKDNRQWYLRQGGYRCPLCQANLASRCRLKTHIQQVHHLSQRAFAKAHGELPEPQCPFTCKICDKTFPWEARAIKRHLLDRHFLPLDKYREIYLREMTPSPAKAAVDRDKKMPSLSAICVKPVRVTMKKLPCNLGTSGGPTSPIHAVLSSPPPPTQNYASMSKHELGHCINAAIEDSDWEMGTVPIGSQTTGASQSLVAGASHRTRQSPATGTSCRASKASGSDASIRASQSPAVVAHSTATQSLAKGAPSRASNSSAIEVSVRTSQSRAALAPYRKCPTCLFTTPNTICLSRHIAALHSPIVAWNCCHRALTTRWDIFIHLEKNHAGNSKLFRQHGFTRSKRLQMQSYRRDRYRLAVSLQLASPPILDLVRERERHVELVLSARGTQHNDVSPVEIATAAEEPLIGVEDGPSDGISDVHGHDDIDWNIDDLLDSEVEDNAEEARASEASHEPVSIAAEIEEIQHGELDYEEDYQLINTLPNIDTVSQDDANERELLQYKNWVDKCQIRCKHSGCDFNTKHITSFRMHTVSEHSQLFEDEYCPEFLVDLENCWTSKQTTICKLCSMPLLHTHQAVDAHMAAQHDSSGWEYFALCIQQGMKAEQTTLGVLSISNSALGQIQGFVDDEIEA